MALSEAEEKLLFLWKNKLIDMCGMGLSTRVKLHKLCIQLEKREKQDK